jgi:hypothetical protein
MARFAVTHENDTGHAFVVSCVFHSETPTENQSPEKCRNIYRPWICNTAKMLSRRQTSRAIALTQIAQSSTCHD